MEGDAGPGAAVRMVRFEWMGSSTIVLVFVYLAVHVHVDLHAGGGQARTAL